MRWSPTLTLFAIEFLAISLPAIHALPLPEDFDLVARTPPAPEGKGKSKELKKSPAGYRYAASQNPTSFKLVDGVLTEVHHTGPHTPQKGQHADHVLEAQTVKAALNSINQTFETLSTPARKELKEEFNGPGNMMFVDGSTNIAKGQLTKKALKGPLPETPQRPDHRIYLPAAHPIAIEKNAPNMDNILKKHNIPGADESPIRKAEKKVQRNMHPNSSRQSSSDTPHTPPQDSPQSSHHGSPQSPHDHGSPQSSLHGSPHGSPKP